MPYFHHNMQYTITILQSITMDLTCIPVYFISIHSAPSFISAFKLYVLEWYWCPWHFLSHAIWGQNLIWSSEAWNAFEQPDLWGNFSIPAFCLANSTLSRLATKLLLTSLSVDMKWAQLYSKVLTYPEIIPAPLQHPWLPQLLFRPCFDLLLYRAGRV